MNFDMQQRGHGSRHRGCRFGRPAGEHKYEGGFAGDDRRTERTTGLDHGRRGRGGKGWANALYASEHRGERGGGRGGWDAFGEGRGGRGGGGGGRGGHGLGRRRLFDNAALRILLLHLLTQDARHGYELIREIEAFSAGVYVPSPGMVYPALTMLSEMEHIAEQPSEGTRKRFAITPAGEAWLTENARDRDAVLARLTTLADQAGPVVDHAPVRRAMENLKASLRNRLQKEGADTETIFDVAALIDEAATKIERLK